MDLPANASIEVIAAWAKRQEELAAEQDLEKLRSMRLERIKQGLCPSCAEPKKRYHRCKEVQ